MTHQHRNPFEKEPHLKMAAPNANGCFPSEADEYEFVLNNALLWDAVFNEFRYDPVLEFGNYKQVSTVMRTQILGWVRR